MQSHCQREYKNELADNLDTIVVQRRKFPCRRRVSPYQQSGTVATPTKATQAKPVLAHPVAKKPHRTKIDKPAPDAPSAKRFRVHAGMSVTKRLKILQEYAKLRCSSPNVTVGEVQTLSKALARLRELKRAHNKRAITRLARALGRPIKQEVARPRQLKRARRSNNVPNPPAAKPLALTPAELTRVREFTWTKVKKGA